MDEQTFAVHTTVVRSGEGTRSVRSRKVQATSTPEAARAALDELLQVDRVDAADTLTLTVAPTS